MRIYIIEDDPSVIQVLRRIVEEQGLGEICGDTVSAMPPLEQILAAKPDLILVDFLMPQRDGIEVVSRLRQMGCTAKCIMLSQISSKEMIAKAYRAGIDFFISKPINVIEVQAVISNAAKQLQNEKTLESIRSIFQQQPGTAGPAAPVVTLDTRMKRVQNALAQMGMSGEKGCADILRLCRYLLENQLDVSQMSVGQLCESLSDNPKNMEQRVRRAIAVGMANLAHLGIEDFMNDTFAQYSSTLFNFEELRAEMDYIRGRRAAGGKISLKKFLDGLVLIAQE